MRYPSKFECDTFHCGEVTGVGGCVRVRTKEQLVLEDTTSFHLESDATPTQFQDDQQYY